MNGLENEKIGEGFGILGKGSVRLVFSRNLVRTSVMEIALKSASCLGAGTLGSDIGLLSLFFIHYLLHRNQT